MLVIKFFTSGMWHSREDLRKTYHNKTVLIWVSDCVKAFAAARFWLRYGKTYHINCYSTNKKKIQKSILTSISSTSTLQKTTSQWSPASHFWKDNKSKDLPIHLCGTITRVHWSYIPYIMDNCRRFGFLVPLWPWIRTKVNKKSIKLQSLMVHKKTD